ncbi:MAG: adenosylcobinamide-phosphate synthase CbiB [Pikeienuella sp.]|uniref:adenosylcobinamide-phosphate synthase CbiB n=1 Tax=Pikeienuella sp. TaxID=2831957 RepID=UPI00391A8146
MVLLFSLLLDALMGDPKPLWRRIPHPVVVFGRVISTLDGALNTSGFRKEKGAAAILLLAGLAAGVGALIEAAPLEPLPQVLAAAVLLAQKSLVDHVSAVAAGLRQSLAEGRAAAGEIVGRDLEAGDEAAVARAAVESAAENFSDGLVAPVFWFALLGLPGLFAYKMVNTADSMIGHRTERHERFGWAAARLDDLLNLAPARLSALLIALAALSPRAALVALRDGRRHRSPNAGWPEAAMAGALGLAVSGPRAYHGKMTDQPWINPEGRREAGPADIDAAVALLWKAWGIVLLAAAVAALA